MSLLLTDNASPGSPDGMLPGFLVEEGGMEKLVIVAISLNVLTKSMERKHVTFLPRDSYAKRGICRRRVSVCLSCLLYTSPSPRDRTRSRMPSSA